MSVVTRVAPSPTGMLHVGTARTALINLAYARSVGGRFVVRIDDTDVARNVPGGDHAILDDMRWLGLDWDGDVVYASSRYDLHASSADRLLADGAAYWCLCPAGTSRPGGRCDCRDAGHVVSDGAVMRFKVPDDGSFTVTDTIRGDVTFNYRDVVDFGLMRADRSVLFLLGNPIDDHVDGVTHVIRGDDHLSNMPKYALVWRHLFDVDLPTFTHLPMIVKIDGKRRPKISKRAGDTVAIADYRDAGYLPSAMLSYIAGLGWADGTDHFITLDSLYDTFDLDGLSTSSAAFDIKKLDDLNGKHVRALADDVFVDVAAPFVDGDVTTIRPLMATVKTRVDRLSDVPSMVNFVFTTPDVDADVFDSLCKLPNHRDIIVALADVYDHVDSWDADTLHDVTIALLTDFGTKLGKFHRPVRYAITGTNVGPPLFDSIATLDRDVAVNRLRDAATR